MGAAALGRPSLLFTLLPSCTFSGIADLTGAESPGVLGPPSCLCVRGRGLCRGFPWGQLLGLVVQVLASFLQVSSCYSSTQWSTRNSQMGPSSYT